MFLACAHCLGMDPQKVERAITIIDGAACCPFHAAGPIALLELFKDGPTIQGESS